MYLLFHLKLAIPEYATLRHMDVMETIFIPKDLGYGLNRNYVFRIFQRTQ
jgi:hypothetical protein